MEAIQVDNQLRKIDAMYHFYGRDPEDRLCLECDHCFIGEYHNKFYLKCTVYGISHSPATDWRKKYHACGLIGKPFPEEDNRIIGILKTQPIRKDEQIPGQVNMFEE